jgi:hypothetical protein
MHNHFQVRHTIVNKQQSLAACQVKLLMSQPRHTTKASMTSGHDIV